MIKLLIGAIGLIVTAIAIPLYLEMLPTANVDNWFFNIVPVISLTAWAFLLIAGFLEIATDK